MNYGNLIKMIAVAVVATTFVACEKSDDFVPNNDLTSVTVEDASLKSAKKSKGFVHGIVVDFEGVDYYLAGPKDGPQGESDAPGHFWVQAGPNKLVGKHYNTGPFGMPQWWSSDAEDGEFMYIVHAIIDDWSLMKAKKYYKKGFVHYHELVRVDNGDFHPTHVLWLKHTAVSRFTLDRGPGGQGSNFPAPYTHTVKQGIDYQFPNNSMMPYNP